jgi:hypothetical protein
VRATAVALVRLSVSAQRPITTSKTAIASATANSASSRSHSRRRKRYLLLRCL